MASRSIPKSNIVEIVFRFVVQFFIGVFVPWFVGAFLIQKTSQKFRHRAEFLAFDSFLAVIVSTPCRVLICVHAAKIQAEKAPILEEKNIVRIACGHLIYARAAKSQAEEAPLLEEKEILSALRAGI